MTKFKTSILLSALIIACFIISIIGGVQVANAATSAYSNVMEDLNTDSKFDINDFPPIQDDYTLQVIQIAESSDNELFIYVYNPCGINMPLEATCINMSLTESPDFPRLYNLEQINRAGVFGKYLVKGVTVKSDEVRFYNITSIYRRFNKYCGDENTGNDNTISEVSFNVSKLFTARTVNSNVLYSCTVTESVTVTNKYAGGVRLGNGITWNGLTGVDAHFVAFDCDYSIDKLFKADVTFTTQTYSKTVSGYKESEVSEPITVPLNYDKKVVIEANNFGNRYEWYEIETVDEFLSRGYSLSPEAQREIKKMQYVLRFYQTSYNEGADGEDVLVGMFLPFGSIHALIQQFTKCSGTRVYDVSILHLDFEADGKHYNLGVVDNKQSGSNDFGKLVEPYKVPWWVWVIIVGVVVVIALILICIFVPGAAPAIGRGMLLIGKGIIFGIYYLFYGLFWVISLPFRLIAKAIKNRKDKPKPSQSRKPAQKPKRKSKPKKAGKKK